MMRIEKLENSFFILKDYEIKTGINKLKGKNGSGKSLFLDSLVLEKQKNKIYDFEKVIYLPQNISFYGRLKLKDYIKFYTLFNHIDIKKIENCNDFYFREICDKKKNIMIYKISGGERIYFMLMLTLLSAKNWYVLDEPFRELDEEHIKSIVKIIEDLRDEGKNFIIVDHQNIDIDYDNEIEFWNSENFIRKKIEN